MSGKVFLVGAGPGEYRFITLMGVDKIKQADVLVYDRLIGNELLNYAKDGCEKIYVGKQSSNHVKTQDEINEILYQKAKENKTVVRLKGGDPFVFGRGGEEGIYLYDRGIDFEVIPGITSAIAGPMMAGIPVTHREVASSFHVITGHLKDEDDEIDWDAIARLKGTLVFLMGMSQKEHIQYSLIEKGMSPDTPVAVITSATTPNQKSIRSTLADFVQEAQNHHLSAPGLIVVGDVVNLQPKLDFAGRRPLKGKKVLITRARQQSSVLKEKVRERGGEPFVFPVIRIKDLREEAGLAETISKMDTYTWIVFTSQNGVSLFFEELFQKGRDVRALHGKKIAAIGKTTAKSLKKYGIVCDLVPDSYVAEDLFKELKPHLKPIDRVLLPRAKGARAYLKEEIEKICPVEDVKIYEAVKTEESVEKKAVVEMLEKGELDYVTFTSSSTVDHLMEVLGEDKTKLTSATLASIGPITSKTLREYGFDRIVEAKRYDIDGLLQAIERTEREKDKGGSPHAK